MYKVLTALTFLIYFSSFSQENRFGAVPLSEEEYLKIPKNNNNINLGFASSTPSSYSLENYVPEVKDQVGSTCTGFAFVYYGLSTQYNYKFNLTNNVDKTGHSFDPYFIYNMINNPYGTEGSCSSGNFLKEVLLYLNDKGAKKRFYSPFLKCDTAIYSDDYLKYTKPYALSSYNGIDIDDNLFYNVRRNLSINKPVIIGLHVTDGFVEGIPFNGLTSSMHYLSRYSRENYHAVTVIGYDDNKFGGAFRIVNSWGKEWGDKGYFWMKYDDFNNYVREAYTMNLSFNINNNKTTPMEDYLYKRKLFPSNSIYEGQVDLNNNPSGIGIYSYDDDENQRINFIGNWSDDGMNGHFIYINETETLSLVYKNDSLVDYKAVSLGFSGGKVDDSLIDQDMFNNYMSSYGKGDPPVRTRAKKVPRRPIK